jgi:alkanesulfonate monooxygenase SsuD/methylene tetrahydromethanopterin reductase-like flavin-dependent oxidoreductase (luciferase family)
MPVAEPEGRRIRFGITHDFRSSPPFDRSASHVYGEALELIDYADDLGFDHVWISEHHFVVDGYCPSPIAVAGAILGRTNRIRVSSHALLLPLYNPIRLAEDIAVLDVISGGRMELGVALGYRPEEFAGLGIDMAHRGQVMDEACDLLIRSWTDDHWSHEGRHFSVRDVSVYPKPVQRPHPMLWVGAQSARGAVRAARLRAPLLLPPPGFVEDEPSVYRSYAEALTDAGADPKEFRVAGTFTCAITDDPAAYREQHREEWAYKADLYEQWDARPVEEGDRKPQRSAGVTGSAERCLVALEETLQGPVPFTDVVMNLRDAEQLRLVAEHILPRYQD